MTEFKEYLINLMNEKNICLGTYIDIEENLHTHNQDTIDYTMILNVEDVINYITDSTIDKTMQEKMRMTFVKIDLKNGNVLHYMNHLGNGIAKTLQHELNT